MKQQTSLFAAIAFAILILDFQPAKAQEIIGTLGDWNTSQGGAGNFGNSPFTPAFGQTFTVPTDGFNTLTDFQLEGNSQFQVEYQANVYAWNGTGVTGSALFTSSELTFNGNSASPTVYVPLDINTGNLTLTGGSQYIMVITTLPYNEEGSSGAIGFLSRDDYGGGGFFENTASSTDGWTSGWAPLGTASNDLAFSATFAAPEPSTWAMMLGGLAALGFVARRKTSGSANA